MKDLYKQEKTFTNPIIPGSYPGPSIIRVEDDYYMVNSTFEYFPALALWHSKDLVHWEHIGHAIDRPEQKLKLDDAEAAGGIQAPTIRYHEGRKKYYITSTAIGKEWPRLDYNFIIEADDPRGPWSQVHWIQNAPGIDCSLFFEDDGKAYYHANRETEPDFRGVNSEIWIQEFDLDKFELVGERHGLWRGMGGIWPEGPHIYKKDGYYYLFISEGGTCHFHAVTLARSENLFGPYQHSERNPLITSRHLHRTYPIQNVGHADIVQTQNGEWYMVALASRPKGGFYDDDNNPYKAKKIEYTYGGYYRNIGRETFLIPMVWEDDWGPIVSPGSGKVEMEYPFPNLEPHPFMAEETLTDFSEPLGSQWTFIRNDQRDFYELKDESLVMDFANDHISSRSSTSLSWIGRRQRHWDFKSEVQIKTQFENSKEETGLSCYTSWAGHIDYFIYKEDDGSTTINVKTFSRNLEEPILNFKEKINYDGNIKLKIEGREQELFFYYKLGNEKWTKLGVADAHWIAIDVAGEYTGSFIAMYASSNGEDSNNKSIFKNFVYSQIDKS